MNAYGTSNQHPHYHHAPPHHHAQYAQSPNIDMMHTFFQQYGTAGTASPKRPYSNAQQSYWGGTHDDAAAAAVWQQQHYR